MSEEISRETQPECCDEALSIKFGKWLSETGFFPAFYNGAEMSYLINTGCMGILYQDPSIDSDRFFGFSLKNPKRIFLGVVRFNAKCITTDKEYCIFEYYGEEYIELAQELCKKMADAFPGLNIIYCLASRDRRFETDPFRGC